MKFEDYCAFTETTAVYPGKNGGGLDELAYLGLGLTGESGEVADCLKKVLRGLPRAREEAVRQEAVRELGDVLWYWCRLCEALGVKPEDVMEMNVRKLEERRQLDALKVHD